MALYDGIFVTPLESDHCGGRFVGETMKVRTQITSEYPDSGLSSLEILPGGRHEFYLIVNPGSLNISCRVWPKDGAGVGSVWLELLEVQGIDVLASDNSVGTDAWETLSISFTAVKTVYKVRLVNRTQPEGDSRCWVDQIVLA